MTRRFVINKHPHVITATEIRIKDSTGVFDPVLRFASLQDLSEHFGSLGATPEALEAARNMVNSTGVATLVFYPRGKRRGASL